MTPQLERVSRTPIIIIPVGSSSLITMFNARELLQEYKFVSSETKKAESKKRDIELLIHRQRNGVSVPYRLIDNPEKLTPADWERVVALFVIGPPWQFKGWPWHGNPVDIFSKSKSINNINISSWSLFQ